jgi:hypothetical protein
MAGGDAHAHQSNVLICDIHVWNIRLDAKFYVKLCDFEGRLLSPDGEALISGRASENAKSFMPRCDKEFVNVKAHFRSWINHISYYNRPSAVPTVPYHRR